MAEYRCPACSSVIDFDDVNVAKDIALCRSCKQTFSFSAVCSSAEIRDVPLDKPPKWIKTSGSYGRSQKLVYSKISPVLLFLIPFTAIWGGGSMIGIYIKPIISGTFRWHQALFGLPFLFGTIVLCSIVLYCLIGKLVVTLEKGELKVFTGVFGIGWTRRIPCGHNTTVSLENNGCKSNGKTVETIMVRTGEKKIGFASFAQRDAKEYIAAYIKKNASGAGTAETSSQSSAGYYQREKSLPSTGYYK